MAGSKNYPSDWHFNAVFSNQFSTWSGHCKKLKLIGNLSDCPQILRVGTRLTYKQQKRACLQIFSFEILFFLNESDDFYRNTPYFLNPILKMFCNFSLKLNMANRRHVFLVLWARKLRGTLNIKRKIKFTLTYVTFKRWFGCSHLEVVKNSTIHFFSKLLLVFSLIASPISFNLI